MNDATKQLRAGLEERGIEYKAINRLVTDIQRNGLFIRVFDYGDDPDFQMCVETRCKTTEQAIEVIAATVGPGTCKLTRASWDDGTCTWGCICSACDAHLEHETGIGYNFCPICGAKVVDE